MPFANNPLNYSDYYHGWNIFGKSKEFLQSSKLIHIQIQMLNYTHATNTMSHTRTKPHSLGFNLFAFDFDVDILLQPQHTEPFSHFVVDSMTRLQLDLPLQCIRMNGMSYV